MNTRSSSYTGRAARSLDDAFGPYARGPIHEPVHKSDRIVLWASACGLAALLVMGAMGVLQ